MLFRSLIQADNATVIGGPIPIQAAQAGGAGNGGMVTIGDDPRAPLTLTTSGAGAHGIVAQSIGGGGAALVIDLPLSQFEVVRSDGGAPNGGGGAVQVMLTGTVATSGPNAYGIVAQSLTNATVLFGTDGIQIVQEPTPSEQGAVQVQLQGSIATTGSGAHGIATYLNTTGGAGWPVAQVGGTVAVSGAGAWGILATNGQTGLSGPSTSAPTTQINVMPGGAVNAAGSAAGAINMADWNGYASADIAGTLSAPNAIALQSNAGGGLNVRPSGVVIGDIVATGANFNIVNSGSITGSVSGTSNYAIDRGVHFLRFDPTATLALGSDSLSVQQLQASDDSVRPILISLPNGGVAPTRIITLNNGNPDFPVPADEPPPFGLYDGTVAAAYTYAYTKNTATITDVSIDFTRGGFSGNSQQLATLANSHLTGWSSDAAASPSSLYALLVSAANATTSTQLAQYLQNLDATASYASVQQSAAAAGAAHANMQSCGNPVGPYSLIDQSQCNWAKALYSVTTLRDGDQRDTSAGISFGRQGEVNDRVYAGASFAYESTSFDGVGSSSDGDRISLGAIVKYIDGPVYASASMVGSYGWADGSRYSTLPWAAGLASSEQETWALTGRLRAGYVFKLGELELMPLVDFDVMGIFDRGYSEQGLDDLALSVAPSNNVLFDVRPALRVGGTARLGNALITSYVEAGALFALNDGAVDVSLPNGPNPWAGVPLSLEREDVMGTLAVSMSIDWGAYELRLLYEGARGETTISQTGSVKFAIKF